MSLTAGERNRRALLVLGGAVALYILTTRLLVWYDDLRPVPEQVSDRIERLQKYKQALSQRVTYEKTKAELEKRIDEANTHFFPSDVAGTTEFQKLVEDAAKAVSINLTQRAVTDSKRSNDGIGEMTMAVMFESTPNQLVSFLAQLKSSPRTIRVRSAQIDPVQVAYEAPKSGELKKNLRANITLAGKTLDAGSAKAK